MATITKAQGQLAGRILLLHRENHLGLGREDFCALVEQQTVPGLRVLGRPKTVSLDESTLCRIEKHGVIPRTTARRVAIAAAAGIPTAVLWGPPHVQHRTLSNLEEGRQVAA
jgi:hypothetical protein